MEAQLAEYRARKAKEKAEIDEQPSLIRRIPFLSVRQTASEERQENTMQKEKEPLIHQEPLFQGPSREDGQTLGGKTIVQESARIWFLKLGLKLLLWFILWAYFIDIQFGAIFFIFSCFVLIWWNLRSGPKVEGEPSAYSVFNPNCEAIQGTVTAEKLQREMMLGPLA